jgi:high affinity sulfate transporter 1
VTAGLTVGLMVVPQSLAYASSLAGLPIKYGLWSSYMGLFVYMFFGTSKDVTLGPTAIMSLLVSKQSGELNKDPAKCEHFDYTHCMTNSMPTAANQFVPVCWWENATKLGMMNEDFGPYSQHAGHCQPSCYSQDPKLTECTYAENAVMLTLLSGLINLAMGVLGFGFIVDFISYPVISGFTSSAALTIGTGQLHKLFGVKNANRKFVTEVHDTFHNLPHAHWPDVLMSVICVGLALYLQQVKKKMDKIPHAKKTRMQGIVGFIGTAGNFTVVLVGTIIARVWYSLDIDDICKHKLNNLTGHNASAVNTSCLTLTGTIPPGIPTPGIASMQMDQITHLIPAAVIVALIGYLESIAIAKAFARQNGYEVAPSQELIGIGFSNIVSFFFHSYPITGSFSRTAVNSASGVATPMSGVVTGIIVMLALQFITTWMYFIPAPALAAIIIVSVAKMFNYEIVLKMLKVNPIDAIPWAVSFFLCTFMDITYGVGLGMGVNIVLQLYQTARPDHPALVLDEKSLIYRPRTEEDDDAYESKGVYEDEDSRILITVMKVGGNLFYSSGNSWKDAVTAQLNKDKSRALVLDYSAVGGIDFSGIQAVLECTDDCAKRKIRVFSASMVPNVSKMLQRAGYWKYSGAPTVESFSDLADAVTAAEGYVLEIGSDIDNPELDISTPLLPSAARRKLPTRKLSGLIGGKMSGMSGDANTIN